MWLPGSPLDLLGVPHVHHPPTRGHVHVGLQLSTGRRALLVSALYPHDSAALRVQLIQLDTNQVLVSAFLFLFLSFRSHFGRRQRQFVSKRDLRRSM
jgi:hypothetical protein